MNANLVRAIIVACSAVLIPQIASAYYAAHMGRWTSRDPFGEIGRIAVESRPNPGTSGDFLARDSFDPLGAYHDGMNLYQYVQSDPLNEVDPDGLQRRRPRPPIGPIVWPIVNPWYGNYCGPFSPPGPPAGPPPRDGLDACCLAHDTCYGPNPTRCALPGGGNPATIACDTALCNCARAFNCGALPWWRRPECYLYRAKIIGYFCHVKRIFP